MQQLLTISFIITLVQFLARVEYTFSLSIFIVLLTFEIVKNYIFVYKLYKELTIKKLLKTALS